MAIDISSVGRDIDTNIQKAIDETKSIESKIVYDRIVEKTEPGSVTNAPNEKLKIIFNHAEPYNARGSYVVFGHQPHKVLTIHNKSDLSSQTEVITTQWYNKVTELVYIVNEGNITGRGTGSRENAISISFPSKSYLHNKGTISAKVNPVHIIDVTESVIDNEGTIRGEGNRDVRLNSTYFINRRTGNVIAMKDGYYYGTYTYFNNQGVISASRNYISTTLGISSGTLNGNVTVSAKDKFINTGIITGGVDFWGTLIHSGVIEGNIYGEPLYGNNDAYLYLKDGVIKGGSPENRPFIKTTIYMDNGTIKKPIALAQGTLVLNENTIEENLPPKIDGSQDSTVKLMGTNTLTDTDKFQNIATWTVDGEWKTAPILAAEKINIESGKLMIDSGAADSAEMAINELLIEPAGAFSHTNNLYIDANIGNKGTIYVGHDPSMAINNSLFPDLTIYNYSGADSSLLVFRGKLGGDNSEINKLVIAGNAEGQSLVKVVNHPDSLGQQTEQGIKLIEIKGDSNAKFSLKERLLVNAYDYSLVKNGKDWYLKSIGLKPDVGVYLANLVAANDLFEQRFHDRIGEPTLMQSAVENKQISPLWVKTSYRNTSFSESQQGVESSIRSQSIQLGLDVLQGKYQDYVYLAGLMAGYGRATTNSYNPQTGYSSSGKLQGYHVGAYASIYANSDDRSGFYADAWMKWNHFSADLFGHRHIDYNLKGITAGLELGYTFNLFSHKGYSYFVQPQGQLIWANVNAGATKMEPVELNTHANNFKTRLGLKFMAAPTHQMDNGLQPFVEFNWLRHHKPYAISFDKTQSQQKSVANIAEIKAGLESKLGQNTVIWLNGSYQFSRNNYRDWLIQLGIRYLF